jgi:hypothetical protein
MSTAIFLIIVGVMSRFLPHYPNAVPLGAIALYAGARLPKFWAVLVPVLVLLLSDVGIDLVQGNSFHPGSRLTTYATFAALAAIGGLVPKRAGVPTRLGMSVVASTVFFLVSNFAVWAEGSGYGFPWTVAGLLACYGAGLAFYPYTLMADLIGTAGLFSLDGVLTRVACWFHAAPARVATEKVEAR